MEIAIDMSKLVSVNKITGDDDEDTALLKELYEEAKTYILGDMVFVRLKGVLTPAEEQLTKTAEGADLIKKTRRQLLEGARILLEKMVYDIIGSPVKSLHTDISTKTGERVIIFTLEEVIKQ